jgi:hypothetical protein
MAKGSDMQRMKNTSTPSPQPIGSLFAGLVIGSAIMAMATQAMLLGAGTAISIPSRKQR